MAKSIKALAILGVVAGLGVAALPLSSYAAETQVTTTGTPITGSRPLGVQMEIEETLSMYVENTTTGTGNTNDLAIMTKADGESIYKSGNFNVRVESGNAKGYYLTMQGTDGDTDLKSGEPSSTAKISTLTIAGALDGTTTTSAWGYQLTQVAGAAATPGTTYQAIPADATQIDARTTAGTQTTSIVFGAYAEPGQEAGTYNGSVTFVATAGQKAGN